MKYLIAILFLFSCTDEKVQPKSEKEPNTFSSSRLSAECEDLTVGNGLTMQDCNIGLGGSLNSDTNIDANGHRLFIQNLTGFIARTNYSGIDVFDNSSATMFADKPDDSHTTLSVQNDGGSQYVILNASKSSGVGEYSNEIMIRETGIYISQDGLELITIEGGKIKINAPTGSTGLSSGDAYYDSNGFLKRVP